MVSNQHIRRSRSPDVRTSVRHKRPDHEPGMGSGCGPKRPDMNRRRPQILGKNVRMGAQASHPIVRGPGQQLRRRGACECSLVAEQIPDKWPEIDRAAWASEERKLGRTLGGRADTPDDSITSADTCRKNSGIAL